MGGSLGRSGDAYFLADAEGLIWLHGCADVLATFSVGDLIVAQVSELKEGAAVISDAQRVFSTQIDGDEGRKPHVERFTRFVQHVREFFLESGLQELFTPTLVKCPGLEPALEPFSTTLSRGRENLTVYLPTSPEVSLKKAMCRGFTDIFEIKNCFRKEEFSPHHESEFLMLEWYRAFADLDLIVKDLEHLLEFLSAKRWIEGAKPKLRQTDFATLFLTLFEFRLTPRTTASELRDLCRRRDLEFAENDTFADLFHRLLMETVEPYLAAQGPTVVRRFPPSLAALAKLDADGWADRAEFYWSGLEIANGFNEVTDPRLQAERWREEADERRRLGRSPVPEDPALIRGLEKGLPPSGGIALGLERLYMACTGVREIRELRLFGTSGLFSG